MLASLCASAQSDTLLMRVGHLPVSRGEFLKHTARMPAPCHSRISCEASSD